MEEFKKKKQWFIKLTKLNAKTDSSGERCSFSEYWVALKRAFGESKLLAIRLILLGLRGGLLSRLAGARCGLAGLLGQQDGLDVGQHAALGDGHAAEQFVELLVVAHGQLQVAGDDTGLLVVPGGVASQLQDLSREVLQDGGQVHGGSGADALRVVPLAEETVDTADGELQTSAGAAGLSLGASFSSGFASSRHDR